ncbi:MAG: DMT family transporter [Vicinamibacterales bacterium]
MTHLLGLLGVLSISFSAVFIRLAAVSPVTAVFFRAVYAVPVLLALWTWTRAGDRRDGPARALAFASGIVLATDLACWHQSIGLVGAGLGTVIANVQVVFIAVLGWLLYDERPTRRTVVVLLAVLTGIVLTSGLARQDAYGDAPVLGVVFGVLAGGFYAGYLLMFRAANRLGAPRAGPLLESTLGMALGAILIAPIDGRFSLVPYWPAHGWLLALALVGQVLGWLLIVTALARLPALETSILLLAQPVFAIVWGRLLFGEHMSVLQWSGTALVLGGVAAISGGDVTRPGRGATPSHVSETNGPDRP